MPAQSYRTRLRRDLGEVIDSLVLTPLQQQCLRARWLDQVLWMEGQATSSRRWYYVLRLTSILGGLLIPALVGLDVGNDDPVVRAGGRYAIVVLSLLVAISVALEQFFSYGERWRHYRRMVETLKIEGWQFFQLTVRYRRYDDHAEAFPLFAARVEEILQRDVEQYIADLTQEQEQTERGGDTPRATDGQAAPVRTPQVQRQPQPPLPS